MPNSKVLEKAISEDIASFQSYTIRNLESKLPVQPDVDQFVAKSVKEDPISNKQQHLDVMSFPGLFPTSTFGEYHLRQFKLGRRLSKECSVCLLPPVAKGSVS